MEKKRKTENDEKLQEIHNLRQTGKFEEIKTLIRPEHLHLPAIATLLFSYAIIKRDCSIIEYLLDRGNINVQDGDGWTILHHSVYLDQMDFVKLLLSKDARFDIKEENGQTSLDLAKQKNNSEIVSLLENHSMTTNLSGVIARGLTDGFAFSDFLVKGICDCRLFIIVAKFAYQ